MEQGERSGLLEENDDSNKISGSDSESVSGAKIASKNVTNSIKRRKQQSISQELYNFLQPSSFSYNMRNIINDSTQKNKNSFHSDVCK